jgi:pyroglutamyl-peptidase
MAAHQKPIRVLVTGFGPFPGAPFNPTGPLAQRLARIRRPAFANVEITSHVFPTTYAAVDHDLPALIGATRPHVILLFGLAARTPHLRVETRARNTRSSFPDAEGFVSSDRRIAANGVAEQRGRAPFVRLLRAARLERMPARLSRDAGRYLCNYSYWHALAAAGAPDGPQRVVFIHVPKVRREGTPMRRLGKKRITAATLARTGEAILRALLAGLQRPH